MSINWLSVIYLLIIFHNVVCLSSSSVAFLLTPDQFTNRLHGSGTTIPDNGIYELQISRPALVQKIISAAGNPRYKHVFLRVARGSGKTILLEEIARHLKEQGKTVFIAGCPKDLDEWYEAGDDEKIMPDYFLVDEVQMDFSNRAVRQLAGKTTSVSNLKTVTIFAGLPENDVNSYILANRFDAQKLLLTEADLLQDHVCQYFENHLNFKAAHGKGVKSEDGALPSVRTAVTRVLRFSLHQTSGLAYACLKVAEFLVEYLTAEELLGPAAEDAMLQLLTSTRFRKTYDGIALRCFDPRKVQRETAAVALCCTGVDGAHCPLRFL